MLNEVGHETVDGVKGVVEDTSGGWGCAHMAMVYIGFGSNTSQGKV